jgi:hypothetical protein
MQDRSGPEGLSMAQACRRPIADCHGFSSYPSMIALRRINAGA